MPPEIPGRSFPRDPSEEEASGATPTFRGGVEQVDEATGGVPAASSSPQPEPSTEPPAAARQDAPRSEQPKRSKSSKAKQKPKRMRVRKVRRVVRHVDPWSVLKLSVLFWSALFLIVCVASALLWSGARTSGAIENVESFITSVGGFGKCEPVDGEGEDASDTTSTTAADQLGPGDGSATTTPDGEVVEPERPSNPDSDEDCPEGEHLVGEFRFEDGRILQAFALAGIVLVLAGTGASVVVVLLFNLMSDLTGGVRVTVLEEDRPSRPGSGPAAGSPPTRPRE